MNIQSNVSQDQESLKKPTKSLSLRTNDRLINGKIQDIAKIRVNLNKLSPQDQQRLEELERKKLNDKNLKDDSSSILTLQERI